MDQVHRPDVAEKDGFPDVDLEKLGEPTATLETASDAVAVAEGVTHFSKPEPEELAHIEAVVTTSEINLAQWGVNDDRTGLEKRHTASIVFEGRSPNPDGPGYMFGCPRILVDGKELPLVLQSVTIKAHENEFCMIEIVGSPKFERQ